MAITGVTKKAGVVFVPKPRRALAFSDAPEPWTPKEKRRSREFAKKAHRIMLARGYTESDIERIIKEVRAELRGEKS